MELSERTEKLLGQEMKPEKLAQLKPFEELCFTLFYHHFAVGARTLVALASAAVHAAVQLLAALGVAGDLGAASSEGFRLAARAFSE